MKTIDITPLIPPDKSSLIRGLLFSLLTDDPVSVSYSPDLPLDIKTAFKCLDLFDKKINIRDKKAVITGSACEPETPINCENSATVMHLLMGIAKYKGWNLRLFGDDSLMRRDHSDFTKAGELYGNGFVETVLSKESAQLKSFHLISMLKNGGLLRFKSQTRRNTEELLEKMGAELIVEKEFIGVKPVRSLKGYEMAAKTDPSSAFIAACVACVCGEPFVIRGIYPEKLRLEPFHYLKKAGYSLSIDLFEDGFEVKGSGIVGQGENTILVDKGEVTKIIDEIPFIAYMSARVGCRFELNDGEWLRNKETDRIHETVKRTGMFFETIEKDDGFIVHGEKKNDEPVFCHSEDHRMEMLSKLIAVDKNIPFSVNGCYNVSFPGFLKMIDLLVKK